MNNISNFTKYKLGDLLKIKNGKDYKSLLHGLVPVYGTGGIITYVNECLFDGESILLPRKGSLQNITYINGKFWTVDTMYWTEINFDLAYPKYLYLYLSLLDLSQLDSGSTLPSMTFNSYYEIPILLPSMTIQKEIGNFVFSIIEKIDINKKQIETLENLAKTIYDYWFVQFDFPNEEGKPYKSSGGKMVWNQELKREIPEGWEVVKIKDILGKYPKTESVETTSYLKNGKYPIIDQSKNYICGFTNKYEHILQVEDAIVFGDHTNLSKYINFPFARGADGTQIIMSKNPALPNYILFRQIKNLPIIEQGYSRHYKFLKDQRLIVPNSKI